MLVAVSLALTTEIVTVASAVWQLPHALDLVGVAIAGAARTANSTTIATGTAPRESRFPTSQSLLL
jgi:hypothetical protein